MREILERIRRDYGKKLISIHTWNGWIVMVLALTGLVLIGGFWRGFLGEGRVWIKWGHVTVGILSILPVIFYLFLAGKHWKKLKKKPWQRFNVLAVLGLLLGWFVSGALLWQFRIAGPRVANIALVLHDILTWIGLPYIIYHSVTRLKWLKAAERRSVIQRTKIDKNVGTVPQPPVYTRRAFIRGAIGAGLAVTLGPSFMKWLVYSLGNAGESNSIDQLIKDNANSLMPGPIPLPASKPPVGGGAEGHFRVYTVAPIPVFTNKNWSFTIDGLVEKSMKWDWEQFVSLKRSVQVSDFHCVTGWSVYKNTWEGIPLTQLLRLAGVKPKAKNVKFYSGDGVYTDTLTLEQASMDDVMVAVMHDGMPIPSDLGGPVRLIVPKMYAYKSVKWLNRIELISEDHIGYWEERGYSNDAWV